nr:putative extracellular serine carboxypeptidase [Quercus suber]
MPGFPEQDPWAVLCIAGKIGTGVVTNHSERAICDSGVWSHGRWAMEERPRLGCDLALTSCSSRGVRPSDCQMSALHSFTATTRIVICHTPMEHKSTRSSQRDLAAWTVHAFLGILVVVAAVVASEDHYKMKSTALLALLAAATGTTLANRFNHRGYGHMGHHFMPGKDDQPVAGLGNTTFTQLIDHDDPSLGTFEQFYYYSSEYWKGPGSPVILFTPGEINATGYQSYLTINRTTGVLAQKIGAAVICLEHRYWGTSTPYTNLTTENMKYLTLDNAIHDLTYFADNVRLPFAQHAPSTADAVPWVMMGGSYSGALSAWTESVAPGTYWAYHASSAPVQSLIDYWAYFVPVQESMPKNCSKDVSLVVDYMDDILMHGSAAEVHDLKAKFGLENVTHNDDFMKFGLGNVTHNDDFMGALENGPWLWQSNQFYTNYSGFFQWCDNIEGVYNQTDVAIPGPEGVGLEKALQGYADWWKEIYFPGFCESYGYPEFEGTYNTYCMDTYDPHNPFFTDTSLSNTFSRQWTWMVCNEPFGYWQTGAPADRPTIVSRLVDAEYWTRQCALFFPDGPNGETYGMAAGRTADDVNAYTGGWQARDSTRLIYANGGSDPWREAGVSAETRPGGPIPSSPQVPINIVPGGFHTSDLITRNGVANAGCQEVIDKELAQLEAWVNEWPRWRRPVGHPWTA